MYLRQSNKWYKTSQSIESNKLLIQIYQLHIKAITIYKNVFETHLF